MKSVDGIVTNKRIRDRIINIIYDNVLLAQFPKPIFFSDSPLSKNIFLPGRVVPVGNKFDGINRVV